MIYERLKKWLFALMVTILLGRFLFLMGDPFVAGLPLSQGLPIYLTWRPLIDVVYLFSDVICWPLHAFYGALVGWVPSLEHVSWFPYMAVSDALIGLYQAAGNPPALSSVLVFAQRVPGFFDWLALAGVVTLGMLSPILDAVFDFLKNLIWNLFIEMAYTRRKQAQYQQALEKRSEELFKLSVENRSLSREASVLKDSVYIDDLTQVYNKRFFLERMRETYETAHSEQRLLSLIVMDIDHFKRLNDTYGHVAGDRVLQAVAGEVRNLTDGYGYCCRFGGEEFCIILPDMGLVQAQTIAEAIHQRVPQLKFDEDPNLRVTLSQGLLACDFRSADAQQLTSYETLVQLADEQLYKAKTGGRDRVCQMHIPALMVA